MSFPGGGGSADQAAVGVAVDRQRLAVIQPSLTFRSRDDTAAERPPSCNALVVARLRYPLVAVS